MSFRVVQVGQIRCSKWAKSDARTQLAQNVEPDRLILDGQQRLTSLYLAFHANKVVHTTDQRRNQIERWYYLDIKKALDPMCDREDAIIGLPDDKKLRNFRGIVELDCSTTPLACELEFFPLSIVFNQVETTKWQLAYLNAKPEQLKERLARWNDLLTKIVNRILQYQVPLIELKRETPKEAVCQVFEKVNTGGVSLNVFELLTATFAADDYNLRDDWAAREKRLRKTRVLVGTTSSDFLQAISLLATRQRRLNAINSGTTPENAPGITCKRKDILDLSLADYKVWAEPVTKGLERAGRLLHALRIFDARDIPYRTQLVPLAAALAVLDDKADHDGVRAKLNTWYWCGVFGELYGGAIETRFARDVPEILAWADGGLEPNTVIEANFNAARLITLKTRNSAAYKGLAAILMKEGALDFRSGDPVDLQMYFDDKIDIHHVFPQDWCIANKIDPSRCDCVVNKTPLSAKTNRQIGGNAPSVYLERLQKTSGITLERMNDILKSHLVDSTAIRADSFDDFFTSRRNAILNRIEAAIGKPVTGRDTDVQAPSEQNGDEDIDTPEV